jgi:hypothetical protein
MKLLLSWANVLTIHSLYGSSGAFLISPTRTHKIGSLLPSMSSKTRLSSTAFNIIQESQVLDPSNGSKTGALDGILPSQNDFIKNILGIGYEKTLVVIMPQLGDFESAEYAEFLSAVGEDLRLAKIGLRVIAIGDEKSAKKFASFNNFDLANIRLDPEGSIHKALGLHAGPDWDIPSFIPNGILEWFADYCGAQGEDRDVTAIARAWLNYMMMCAGVAAPDTLPEIFRGYVGDKNAPERIRPDEVVKIGDKDDPIVVIKGVSDVKLGPFEYQQLWKDERGYQRPVELATVRLRVMVEVLTNFNEYVSDQRFLDLRGATYLFDNKSQDVVYEHVDNGVLAYSKTMARPLTFLEPYIGAKALNPLGLGDPMSEAMSG